MFIQNLSIDDISMTKDIYPGVAKALRNHSGAIHSPAAFAKRMERLAKQCWHALVDRDLVV